MRIPYYTIQKKDNYNYFNFFAISDTMQQYDKTKSYALDLMDVVAQAYNLATWEAETEWLV